MEAATTRKASAYANLDSQAITAPFTYKFRMLQISESTSNDGISNLQWHSLCATSSTNLEHPPTHKKKQICIREIDFER